MISFLKKIGMENFKSFNRQIHDVSSITKVHKIIFKFIFVTGKLGFAEYGLGLLASEKAECQNAGPCFSLYNKDFVLFAISIITTVITNIIFRNINFVTKLHLHRCPFPCHSSTESLTQSTQKQEEEEEEGEEEVERRGRLLKRKEEKRQKQLKKTTRRTRS